MCAIQQLVPDSLVAHQLYNSLGTTTHNVNSLKTRHSSEEDNAKLRLKKTF